jgi:hypothetical protein
MGSSTGLGIDAISTHFRFLFSYRQQENACLAEKRRDATLGSSEMEGSGVKPSLLKSQLDGEVLA